MLKKLAFDQLTDQTREIDSTALTVAMRFLYFVM